MALIGLANFIFFPRMNPEDLKSQIITLSKQYSELMHQQNRPGYAGSEKKPEFIPGETTVPYAGRVFTPEEVGAAISSTLDFWLTLGPEGDKFERGLADVLGVKRSLLVNSGSSANLVAFAGLTTHKLPNEHRILPGDEVITVAAGFPTTVAPIIQNGAVPVFIDANPVTGNARCEQLEDAYVEGKTKAVMMAHALGNPFDLGVVLDFCKRHNLWLIEDNCDALGCSYTLPGSHSCAADYRKKGSTDTGEVTRLTGSFGDISTQSFYPPHHLTMGEGGAVSVVRDMRLKTYIESFRDWGRDCWCPSGKDDTCNKRFGWQLGDLPEGYDHKYIYSHIGYNVKPLDPQAAIGSAQLKKLPAFIEARKDNWTHLRRGLAELEDVIDFALPTHATGWNTDGSFSWDDTGCRTDCSWFGFLMLVKPNAPFTRTQLARALDEAKIGNRMLFGGNLVRQPAFVNLARERPEAMRTVGDLQGADRIMNEAVFIGTYPGLTTEMLDYMIEVIIKSARNLKK